MNTELYNQQEQAVLLAARNAFNNVRHEYERHGLTLSDPEIRVWADEPTEYTSEMTATVYRGREIVDVIEFLIFHKGNTMATLEEIRDWLNEVTRSIISEVDADEG